MSEPRPTYAVADKYHHRLTADEKATIVRLYDDGYAIKHIARAVGRPSQCVSQHLVRVGLHTTFDRRAPDTHRAQAVDWYQRGIGIETITRQFHISSNTVYKELRRRGIPLRYPAMSRSTP